MMEMKLKQEKKKIKRKKIKRDEKCINNKSFSHVDILVELLLN